MDYQGAIEIIEYASAFNSENSRLTKALNTAISAMQELREYKNIGTLEEVREAAEKQHPKTPTWDGDGYAPDGTFVWDEWKCPRCGTRYEVEYDDYDYCPNCGQRIYLHADWSEEDD